MLTHLGKIRILCVYVFYIYIYICFGIITFTKQNKERQVVLDGQPQGLAGSFQGSLALLWAGVSYQQPGPAMGHGMGMGVQPGWHSSASPLSTIVTLRSSPLVSETGLLSPLALPDRPPKMGMAVATTTWLEYKLLAPSLLQTWAKLLSLWDRSFAPTPCLGCQGFVRVKEIVLYHHLTGKQLWIWTFQGGYS